MIIGLDVGGTHTDIVLMKQQKILSSTKVITNQQDLLDSIRQGLAEVLRGRQPEKIDRLHLSTTLSTNAIVEEALEPVGRPGISRTRNSSEPLSYWRTLLYDCWLP